MSGQPRPAMYTREFVFLNTVLFIASAMMALFFQFQTYLVSLNIDPAWHGFLIGADAIAGIVLQPLLSPYLHMRNARWVGVCGVLIMVAAMLSYQFAFAAWSLAVIRIVQGSGFVLVFAAMVVLFSGYIPPSRSGEAFGIISIMRLIPYAIVPPAVVFLITRSCGFISIVTLAGWVLALCLIPFALIRRGTQDRPAEKILGFSALIESIKTRSVWMLLLVNILFYSAYTTLFFFFKRFGTLKGVHNPGYFFTIATIVMIVVRAVFSRYFDRFNKPRLCALCLAVLAVCNVLTRYIDNPDVYLALSAAFGIAWGIAMPLMMSLVFDVSEPRFRGLNMNLSMVMMQAGFFIGPFAGGMVLAEWDYDMLFVFCGVLNAAGAFLIVAVPAMITKQKA